MEEEERWCRMCYEERQSSTCGIHVAKRAREGGKGAGRNTE
jgi:hypothetical protein